MPAKANAITQFLSSVSYKNLLFGSVSCNPKWGFFDDLKGVIQKIFWGIPYLHPDIRTLLNSSLLHAPVTFPTLGVPRVHSSQLIILCCGKLLFQTLLMLVYNLKYNFDNGRVILETVKSRHGCIRCTTVFSQ